MSTLKRVYCMIPVTPFYIFLIAAPVVGFFKEAVTPVLLGILSRIVGANEQGRYKIITVHYYKKPAY